MPERSWISHYIVPCTGNSSCKYCKPGEPHPQQHAFSKRVTEQVDCNHSTQVNESMRIMYTDTKSPMQPISVARERYLKKRKLIGAIFGNLELISFDPELDPEPFTCYNCWNDDHLRRDCPEPILHVYCRNCGRRDVEVQHCPRCAKAYQEFLQKWEGNDQERRRLSVALYKSRQFFREEDLCPVDSMKNNSVESEQKKRDREADDCCDLEVNNIPHASFHEESNSSKSLIFVDECWTDSDNDVYQSFETSFAIRDSESTVKSKCDKIDECHSELYESVQASFVVMNEIAISAAAEGFEGEFCSSTGDNDYESTRGAFIRECDSVYSDEYEQKSSSVALSSSFNDECPVFSESFRETRDAELNELFVYIRNKKIQDELAANPVNLETRLKHPVKSKLYRFNEIEDNEEYDDVIVDENERSELLGSADYAIQEFINLLDTLKHLPIEVQNIAVLHFVSERKKTAQPKPEENDAPV